MSSPLISVVMPTWNRAHYLSDALESILNQSVYQKNKPIETWKPFRDYEVIVVDDGSDDGTDQLMDYYTKLDPRIIYLKREHSGIAETRNAGVQKSRGKYIAVHDSDDWMAKDRLWWSVKTLEKGDCDVVYGAYHVTQENGHFEPDHLVVPPEKVTVEAILANDPAIPHPTMAARRECFIDHPYRDELRSNDDMALVMDWFNAGYRFKYIDRSLIAYRTHPQSVGITDSKFIDESKKKLMAEFKEKNV